MKKLNEINITSIDSETSFVTINHNENNLEIEMNTNISAKNHFIY